MLKLISLLGTNAYVPCNYFFKDREDIKARDCCYVQTAILDILWQQNIKPDEIIVFTTNDAVEINWNKNKWSKNNQQNRFGLREELQEFKEKTGINYKNVIIPNGINEEDLWEIFNRIFDNINENDEIIFDITHSFRYLPMLVFIVINYARIVKKCKLKAVYYGAFEVLGDHKAAQNISIDDRDAPIFDLTSFVDLFDWTVGIDRYLNTGDVSVIKELTETQIKRINATKVKLVSTSDQSTEKMIDKQTLFMDSNLVKSLSISMKEFSDVVFTCRGLALTEAISRLKVNLDNVMDNASKQHIIPLLPVIKMMKERFDKFSMDNNYINVIETARWCVDNKMYQQGLTILEEGLISYACEKLGYTNIDDIINENNRKSVGSYSYVAYKELGVKDKKIKNTHVLNLVSNNVTDLFILLYHIGNIRNDINHAGWRKEPSKVNAFEKNLRDFITRAEKIILNESLTQKVTAEVRKSIENNQVNDRKMLLIFSHKFTFKQKEKAIQQFGISRFLPLPSDLLVKWSNVPSDLEDLHDYLNDILKWIDLNAEKGDYACIQGDYGVTYITVNYCLSKGIIPVYFTTKRNVKWKEGGDNSKTIRELDHVMFRKYKD